MIQTLTTVGINWIYCRFGLFVFEFIIVISFFISYGCFASASVAHEYESITGNYDVNEC